MYTIEIDSPPLAPPLDLPPCGLPPLDLPPCGLPPSPRGGTLDKALALKVTGILALMQTGILTLKLTGILALTGVLALNKNTLQVAIRES